MAENNNIAIAQLAADILLRKDGKVLLLQRADNGKWCVPGGRLDVHESIWDAAIREAHEEIAVTISKEDLQLVHIDHGIFRHGEMVIFCFVCDVWEGEASNAEPDKANRIGWFSPEQLPDDMSAWHRHFVETHMHDGMTFDEWLVG